MKFSTWIWIIIGAVVLVGLLMWPRLVGPASGLLKEFKAAGIDCIAGHTNLGQHIHPHLSIQVDGIEETIPANLGILPGCMAEVHTHDTTGTIHTETASSAKQMHLKQFMTAYQIPLERPGYSLAITVDGQPTQEGVELILRDKQVIVLEYRSK